MKCADCGCDERSVIHAVDSKNPEIRMAAHKFREKTMEPNIGQAANTDREIWRERPGDYYSDSIHVTQSGGIGINCGGTVFVLPVREWHELGRALLTAPPDRSEVQRMIIENKNDNQLVPPKCLYDCRFCSYATDNLKNLTKHNEEAHGYSLQDVKKFRRRLCHGHRKEFSGGFYSLLTRRSWFSWQCDLCKRWVIRWPWWKPESRYYCDCGEEIPSEFPNEGDYQFWKEKHRDCKRSYRPDK